jgi:hypothetical protein
MSRGALRRAHWLTGRKRQETTRKRPCSVRQRPSFPWYNPIGLAFSRVHGPRAYLAGPMASTFGTSNDLVSCGHMFGLFVRSKCPLALMKSDDLYSLFFGRMLLVLGGDRVVHHAYFGLPNSNLYSCGTPSPNFGAEAFAGHNNRPEDASQPVASPSQLAARALSPEARRFSRARRFALAHEVSSEVAL